MNSENGRNNRNASDLVVNRRVSKKRKRSMKLNVEEGLEFYRKHKFPKRVRLPSDTTVKSEFLPTSKQKITELLQSQLVDCDVKKFLLNGGSGKHNLKLNAENSKIVNRCVELNLITITNRTESLSELGHQADLRGSPAIIVAAFLKSKGSMTNKDLSVTPFAEWPQRIRKFAIKWALSKRWITRTQEGYKANRMPLLTEDIILDRNRNQKVKNQRKELAELGFMACEFEIALTPLAILMKSGLSKQTELASVWRDALLEQLLYLQVRHDLIKLLLHKGASAKLNLFGRQPWEVLFGNYPAQKERKKCLIKRATKLARSKHKNILNSAAKRVDVVPNSRKQELGDFRASLMLLLKHGMDVNLVVANGSNRTFSFAETMLRMNFRKEVHVPVDLHSPDRHRSSSMEKSRVPNMKSKEGLLLAFRFGLDPFNIFVEKTVSKFQLNHVDAATRSALVYTCVALGVDASYMFRSVNFDDDLSILYEEGMLKREEVQKNVSRRGMVVKRQLSGVAFVHKVSDAVWKIICQYCGPATFFMEYQARKLGVNPAYICLKTEDFQD